MFMPHLEPSPARRTPEFSHSPEIRHRTSTRRDRLADLETLYPDVYADLKARDPGLEDRFSGQPPRQTARPSFSIRRLLLNASALVLPAVTATALYRRACFGAQPLTPGQ